MGGFASREEDEVVAEQKKTIPSADRGWMVLANNKRVTSRVPPPQNFEPGVWSWCIPSWPTDHHHSQLPLIPLTIMSNVCHEPKFRFRIRITRNLEGYEFELVPVQGEFPGWEAAVSAVSSSETLLSTPIAITSSESDKPVTTIPLHSGKSNLRSSFGVFGVDQPLTIGTRPLADPAELPGPYVVTFTFDYSTIWERHDMPSQEKYRTNTSRVTITSPTAAEVRAHHAAQPGSPTPLKPIPAAKTPQPVTRAPEG